VRFRFVLAIPVLCNY